MLEYIKNQAESIVNSIKEFEVSEYFTLNYKETRKFSFTMLCIGIGLYLTGLLVEKLIKLAKENAPAGAAGAAGAAAPANPEEAE